MASAGISKGELTMDAGAYHGHRGSVVVIRGYDGAYPLMNVHLSPAEAKALADDIHRALAELAQAVAA